MLSLAGRRIAIVSRLYAPEPGAASFRLAALARALRDAGAEVVVLTTRPPAGYPIDDEPGIEVRRARVLRDRAGYVRGYLQYLSFDIPAFFRTLFAGRLDAVVVEPPPTTGLFLRIACGIRRTPYVYYAADIWSEALGSTSASALVARAVRGFERFAARGAARVLSVSDEVTTRLRGLGADRVATVGNGVDTVLFTPEGSRRRLDAPYLLYAGTASEVHGARIFADALAALRQRVPDARVVFVGQGAERAEIERIAHETAPGALHAEGRLSPEETAEWIRGAAATLASVDPSGYAFAFPTKMYASIACGTPVIYTGTGPGREFAQKDGFGWGVDYEPSAVTEAMAQALEAPIDQKRRRARAEWARQNLSLDAVAARAAVAVGEVVRR